MSAASAPPGLTLDVLSAEVRVGTDEAVFGLSLDSLRVTSGQMIAFTGPSGCGKSTMLEFLALLIQPVSLSQFIINGRDDLTADMRAGRLNWLSHYRATTIGYVPQSGGVIPFLTARRHAETGLRLVGLAGDVASQRRFEALAEALGLRQHLEKSRTELSGGQRKRVALLAGMAVTRRLLLADEPTSGLDDATGRGVFEVLADLAATEGTSVIIATHDTTAAREAGFDVVSLVAPRFRHDNSEVLE